MEHIVGDAITIRYDGLDADDHAIDLFCLSESLKGLARIIAVAGNFAATQEYIQHKDSLHVRVVAIPPEAHCFEMGAIIQWVTQPDMVTTVAGGLTVTLVSYIFSRLAGNKAEMKELRGALDVAIKEIGNRDQKVVDRLLDTVDRMADALRPAAKQAVSPIGVSASTLSISSGVSNPVSATVGIAEREAIDATQPIEITSEANYTVMIHEMNMDTSTCKVSFRDEPDVRIPASITDPMATIPNNRYAVAFAGKSEIKVKGKAAIRDGLIEKLFISDAL